MKWNRSLLPLVLPVIFACDALKKQAEKDPSSVFDTADKVAETAGKIFGKSAPTTSPEDPSNGGGPSIPGTTTAGGATVGSNTVAADPSAPRPSATELAWHPLAEGGSIAALACRDRLPGGRIPALERPGVAAILDAALAPSGELVLWITGVGAMPPWFGVWKRTGDRLEHLLTSGDPLPGVEVMGSHRKRPSPEMVADGYGPALAMSVQKCWVGYEGVIGLELRGNRAKPIESGSVHGFWRSNASGISPVGFVGEISPDGTGANGAGALAPARTSSKVLRGIDQAHMSSSGAFFFLAGKNTRLALVQGGATRIVAEVGQPAPGLPGNGALKIANISLPTPAATGGDAGLVQITYSGPGGNGQGVWLASESGLKFLAANGLPIAMNRSGEVCLQEKRMILAGKPGSLVAVRDFSKSVVGASLDDGNLFLAAKNSNGSPGSLYLGSAKALTELEVPTPGEMPTTSPGGFLAVGANVRGASGDSRYVLLVGRESSWTPLLRLGERITVSPGDERVVKYFRTLAVDDRGEVLVRVQFQKELGVRDETEGLFLVRAEAASAGESGNEAASVPAEKTPDESSSQDAFADSEALSDSASPDGHATVQPEEPEDDGAYTRYVEIDGVDAEGELSALRKELNRFKDRPAGFRNENPGALARKHELKSQIAYFAAIQERQRNCVNLQAQIDYSKREIEEAKRYADTDRQQKAELLLSEWQKALEKRRKLPLMRIKRVRSDCYPLAFLFDAGYLSVDRNRQAYLTAIDHLVQECRLEAGGCRARLADPSKRGKRSPELLAAEEHFYDKFAAAGADLMKLVRENKMTEAQELADKVWKAP